MENQRALIAMSGGVDSSVAAYLTLQKGLQCIGGSYRTCGISLRICNAKGYTVHIRDQIRHRGSSKRKQKFRFPNGGAASSAGGECHRWGCHSKWFAW